MKPNPYLIKSIAEEQGKLYWHSEWGIGYLPATTDIATQYDRAYFEKYIGYAKAIPGINKTRTDLVDKYAKDKPICDVGIGCGSFVMGRSNTYGFDINPVGVEWLTARNAFLNPYTNYVHSATFWDSLEHIPDPQILLDHVSDFAFISAPIYENKEAMLKSKHYRPNEHLWYHTLAGMVNFMGYHGFYLLHHDRREEEFGRQDIATYVFKR